MPPKNPFAMSIRNKKPQTTADEPDQPTYGQAGADFDPEATIQESGLQRRRFSVNRGLMRPAQSATVVQSTGRNFMTSTNVGSALPLDLGDTAMPAKKPLDEATANAARSWMERGYQLPEDPVTGLPVMPNDPRYAKFMKRNDITEVQKANYRRLMGKDMPYYAARPQVWQSQPGVNMWQMPANLETMPRGPMNLAKNRQTLIGEQMRGGRSVTPMPTVEQTPMEKQYGLPPDPRRVEAMQAQVGPVPFRERSFLGTGSEQPDYATKDSMTKFNRLYAQERTKKQGFKDLNEYDQWFANVFDQVPGAEFIGDAVREKYYLKNMPAKVREEYQSELQNRQIRRADADMNTLMQEAGLADRGKFAGGQFFEKSEDEIDAATEARLKELGLIGTEPGQTPYRGVVRGKLLEDIQFAKTEELEKEERKVKIQEASEGRRMKMQEEAEARKEKAKIAEEERRMKDWEEKQRKTLQQREEEYDKYGNEEWKNTAPILQKHILEQMAKLEIGTPGKDDFEERQAELQRITAKYFTAKPPPEKSPKEKYATNARIAEMRKSNPALFTEFTALSKVVREAVAKGATGLEPALTRLQEATPDAIETATMMVLDAVPSDRKQEIRAILKAASAKGDTNAIVLTLKKFAKKRTPTAGDRRLSDEE